MTPIPTAEEYMDKRWKEGIGQYQSAREFAQLHVQAALEAAAEKGKVKVDSNLSSWRKTVKKWTFNTMEMIWGTGAGDGVSTFAATVDKDSILTAYPLSNIKR